MVFNAPEKTSNLPSIYWYQQYILIFGLVRAAFLFFTVVVGVADSHRQRPSSLSRAGAGLCCRSQLPSGNQAESLIGCAPLSAHSWLHGWPVRPAPACYETAFACPLFLNFVQTCCGVPSESAEKERMASILAGQLAAQLSAQISLHCWLHIKRTPMFPCISMQIVSKRKTGSPWYLFPHPIHAST